MNKAAIRTRYGSPECIEIKDMDLPSPAPHEVVVRVYHTTVNRTDCGILWGKPFPIRFFAGLFSPKSQHPGTDFAGQIISVGSEVKDWKEGDRVFGFNDEGAGTQAQYLAYNTKGHALAAIPDGIDYVNAVAALEGTHYALNFINKVELSAGQKVMVNGGTGAIGSAAIQVLKSRGLYVVATAPTGYLDRVRALGADRVIDYMKEDYSEDKERFTFVFDAVGKSRFVIAKKILEPKGIYISSELGKNGENLLLALISPLSKGKKLVFPIPKNIPQTLKIVGSLLVEGKLKPLIDRHYPLSEIREAYTYVHSGRKIGSVVLDFDE